MTAIIRSLGYVFRTKFGAHGKPYSGELKKAEAPGDADKFSAVDAPLWRRPNSAAAAKKVVDVSPPTPKSHLAAAATRAADQDIKVLTADSLKAWTQAAGTEAEKRQRIRFANQLRWHRPSPFKAARLVFPKNLSMSHFPDITELPSGLRIRGSFTAGATSQLTSTPAHFTVTKFVHLKDCPNLEKINDGIRVKTDMTLEGLLQLTSLPSKIRVWRHAEIINCPQLRALPESLFDRQDLPLEVLATITLQDIGIHPSVLTAYRDAQALNIKVVLPPSKQPFPLLQLNPYEQLAKHSTLTSMDLADKTCPISLRDGRDIHDPVIIPNSKDGTGYAMFSYGSLKKWVQAHGTNPLNTRELLDTSTILKPADQ